MSYLKYLLIITFNLFLISSSAQARWANYEDAAIEFKFTNTKVNVNKDGTFEEEKEIQAKILKESGRESFAQYYLSYNEYSAHIDILEAKIIYNGQEYIVTKDMIEDKPIASVGQGFDQMHQVTVSFPKVEIGAEIYLKYKYTEKKAVLDNFYGEIYSFRTDGYIQAGNINIKSKIPLQMKVNDPRDMLEVNKKTQDEIDIIDITLKRPFYEHLTNEPNNGILDDKQTTWVSLSSISEWKDLANKLAPGYYQVINQPLPKSFKLIKDSAANKDSDIEKINFVTSALNEKVQYMGDWRTVEGRYFPRDLSKIASSQIGDCKDFTASTASILQALDYKVQPILVMRGIYNISNPDALPFMANFNHVMLKVTNKDEKIYWVDPTNVVSMAQGVFPDIANKLALVLDSKEGRYTKIPAVQAENSRVLTHRELTIQNNIIDEEGQITLGGESALNLTGIGLYYSNTQLKDLIFREISGAHLSEEEKKSLKLPDLTSRIVKNLTLSYALQQKNKILKTNLGLGLLLDSNQRFRNVIDTAPDQQVSDIFIGVPEIREKHTIIKNIEVKNCNKLNFEIESPWISVNRSCKYQGDNTEFIDVVTIKRSFITNGELKTDQYKNLKSSLENNFDRATIIVNE
ncbi:MAG: DUF3857 domain-containing protein [Candidatus Rickettsia vulgarisii]